MVSLLFLLCFLGPVCSLFDGSCPRKDPPPGVLVVSPGSKLLITCNGDVKVNGVKVNLTRAGPNANNKRTSSIRVSTTQKTASNPTVSTESVNSDMVTAVSEGYSSSTTVGAVSTVPGENTDLTTKSTTSLNMVHQASPSRTSEGKSILENEEVDSGYEAESGDKGSRVTRGIKSNTEWKWNNQPLWKKDRHSGDFTFLTGGAILSLASVRLTDAGKYTCHLRGREMSAIKVIVADPPESPQLHCYKKSPTAKIRCEWRPQKPLSKKPNCYLFLSKGKFNFTNDKCSYSPQHYCWCVLDDNEDERSTHHMAFLCVTSIIGNATSPLLYFTPLGILKPDPPTNVSVHQEEGQRRILRVIWNLPVSWKEQGQYYVLIYEIKYKPLMSSNVQVNAFKDKRSYTITDALPGFTYVIQLRMKEEYDGDWSEWSSPVNATSWTETADASSTEFNWIDTEGSGSTTGDYSEDNITSNGVVSPYVVPDYIIWSACLFALFSVILAVYIVRHKDKFMSKLHIFNVTPQLGDVPPPPPSTTIAPEGVPLVTFDPQLYMERPLNDKEEGEENEEEQTATDRTEGMHFNNASYYLL